jgi:hypothetical protein
MLQGVFGEFRTTFRTIPRLREAGAKFQNPVLMGKWLGFQYMFGTQNAIFWNA